MEKDLEGTVCQVNEDLNQVFVIWHGTHFEDEMKPEELNILGVDSEIPSAGYSMS